MTLTRRSLIALCLVLAMLARPVFAIPPQRRHVPPPVVHHYYPSTPALRRYAPPPMVRHRHRPLTGVIRPAPAHHRRRRHVIRPVIISTVVIPAALPAVAYVRTGILTRDAFLWHHPAKVGRHIQKVRHGTQVHITSRQNDFYAATLPNGRQGWLPADAVRCP